MFWDGVMFWLGWHLIPIAFFVVCLSPILAFAAWTHIQPWLRERRRRRKGLPYR